MSLPGGFLGAAHLTPMTATKRRPRAPVVPNRLRLIPRALTTVKCFQTWVIHKVSIGTHHCEGASGHQKKPIKGSPTAE